MWQKSNGKFQCWLLILICSGSPEISRNIQRFYNRVAVGVEELTGKYFHHVSSDLSVLPSIHERVDPCCDVPQGRCQVEESNGCQRWISFHVVCRCNRWHQCCDVHTKDGQHGFSDAPLGLPSVRV